MFLTLAKTQDSLFNHWPISKFERFVTLKEISQICASFTHLSVQLLFNPYRQSDSNS